MNTITRWNPLQEIDDLHAKLNSYFGLAPLRSKETRENITVSEWAPAVDITEDDKEYVIRADLADVKKEDVSVRVEGGILTLSGERKFEKEEKQGKRYHRIERSYGAFVRRFGIPDDADPSKIEATFKEGVLKVRLSKHEVAQPKTVEVRVG